MANPTSSSTSLKTFCCCIFLLLIFLSLLTLAILLLIILLLRPTKPHFNLHRVSLQYLLISSAQLPSPSAYLSLNITLFFAAENPNKVGIKYEATDLCVLYRGLPLGMAEVSGFEQKPHSRSLVESRVSVRKFNVLEGDALELLRDATVGDRVELRITGDVGAKIRLLGFTSPRVQVSVDCLIVISPRKQSLAYKQCGVDGLNV